MLHALALPLVLLLQLPQARVQTAVLQQLDVAALFDDAPRFHHHDAVGIDDCRQAMGYHQRGVIACRPAETFQDHLLGMTVEA